MTSFEEEFQAFSKFGDTRSTGHQITLTQSDKWMKQAKVFTSKLTTTDTAIHFNKLKSKKLDLAGYNTFLEDLAKTKKIDLNELKEKMASCGEPGVVVAGVSGKAKDNVNRMTDTALYTGHHKERFGEDGKGKGLEGRKYLADGSGYVSGYKNKDTYDDNN